MRLEQLERKTAQRLDNIEDIIDRIGKSSSQIGDNRQEIYMKNVPLRDWACPSYDPAYR